MLSNTKELYAFGRVIIRKNSSEYYSASLRKEEQGLFYVCESKLMCNTISEALEDLRNRVNKDHNSILLLINDLSEEK